MWFLLASFKRHDFLGISWSLNSCFFFFARLRSTPPQANSQYLVLDWKVCSVYNTNYCNDTLFIQIPKPQPPLFVFQSLINHTCPTGVACFNRAWELVIVILVAAVGVCDTCVSTTSGACPALCVVILTSLRPSSVKSSLNCSRYLGT